MVQREHALSVGVDMARAALSMSTPMDRAALAVFTPTDRAALSLGVNLRYGESCSIRGCRHG